MLSARNRRSSFRSFASIDKQNTLTGLKIRRDELENLRAAIVPVLDAANKLGAVRFDMNRLIPAELPDRLQSSAEKITSIMSGLTGGAFTSGAKEQAQAIEQTAQAIQAEAQKIADASNGYDAHKIAVEAAAAAEATRARSARNIFVFSFRADMIGSIITAFSRIVKKKIIKFMYKDKLIKI